MISAVGHVLARSRQIVEPALWAVEIPLAGSVQGLEHVLHPIDRGRGGAVAPGGRGDEGEEARAVEGDRARLALDALNRQPVVQPPRDPDNLHISQIAPRGHDVARGIDELLRRTPEKVTRVAWQRFDAVFPLPGQPRPRPAVTIHEQLPEAPRSFLHLRNVHHPGPLPVGFAPAPAPQTASPAEHSRSLRLPPRKPPELALSPSPPDRTPAVCRGNKCRRAARRGWTGVRCLSLAMSELRHERAPPSQMARHPPLALPVCPTTYRCPEGRRRSRPFPDAPQASQRLSPGKDRP